MPSQFAAASIFNTEARDLTSSLDGMTYTLSVWLPQSYSRTTKTFPVVYVLDANVFFGTAAESVWSLTLGGEIPDPIVVGIGHQIKDLEDWNRLRVRYFTPTEQPGRPGSGKAGVFASALKDEIIPFVEANYRADPDERTIFGYSLGGLFAAFALFRETDLFRNYVIGSGALYWDGGVIFNHESEFAAKQRHLPKRCFLSVGSKEPNFLPHVTRFHEILERRSYEGLDLTFEVFENETHSSGPALSFVHGMKAVFCPK